MGLPVPESSQPSSQLHGCRFGYFDRSVMLRNGLDMLDALPERQRESLLAAASFISDVSPQNLNCQAALRAFCPSCSPWS
jgi:hypothetical protein